MLRGFRERGHDVTAVQIGRLAGWAIPSLELLVAVGGHGKAQFAVQAQHLIERHPSAAALLCVGAAGALEGALRFGDVVVGTATIEHDFIRAMSRRPPPRHDPDPALLAQLMAVARTNTFPFAVHFDAIAGGDEDIVDPVRARALRAATGARCVAWEGGGAARAAGFNGVPFLEVRCITDGADANAAADFRANLEQVMPNLAALLVAWRGARG